MKWVPVERIVIVVISTEDLPEWLQRELAENEIFGPFVAYSYNPWQCIAYLTDANEMQYEVPYPRDED